MSSFASPMPFPCKREEKKDISTVCTTKDQESGIYDQKRGKKELMLYCQGIPLLGGVVPKLPRGLPQRPVSQHQGRLIDRGRRKTRCIEKHSGNTGKPSWKRTGYFNPMFSYTCMNRNKSIMLREYNYQIGVTWGKAHTPAFLFTLTLLVLSCLHCS